MVAEGYTRPEDGGRQQRAGEPRQAAARGRGQEDVARIKAVREAIGPNIRLHVDGNCSFDLPSAERAVAGGPGL